MLQEWYNTSERKGKTMLYYLTLALIILTTALIIAGMLLWAFAEQEKIDEEIAEMKRKSFIKYPDQIEKDLKKGLTN